MLFDHDSADSLRSRAETSSQGNKTRVVNQPVDVSAHGTAPSNTMGSGFEANVRPGRTFGITVDDIGKFDNNAENLTKFGGVEGIANILKVDSKKGIDATLEDLIARAQQFGENTYPVSKLKPFWRYVFEALQDPTLLILGACAAVSLVVGLTTEDPKEGWYDGGGVSFAIILVLLVSSTSNYRQSLQFRALTAENQKIMVNVTRGGKRMKIIIFELVVGDIVHLAVGDQIPGDGLLLVGNSLVVDESSMTGESEPAIKDATHPFLISGCKVMDGTGIELITAVGMQTEWGKVMATLAVDNEEETPLQVRLNQLSENIGKIGMTVAVSVFLVLLIRLLVESDLKHFTAQEGRKIVNFFAISVTIIVVAVPEGLPLAVTLTLAYSMHKMMDDRALVRNLSACETMGSATTICSDKTGTLTMNLMTVVSSWVCGKLRASTEMDKEISKKVEERIFASICLNTNGHVGLSSEGAVEISGSPTEVACLNWAVKLGAVFDDIQKDNKIICVDTFNSTKKRMGVVVQDKDGSSWVHWKGASEVLLKQCTKYVDADGTIFDLTSSKREELEGIIMTFANAALRTLCFACKELNERELSEARTKKKQLDLPDRDLICLSIVGIKDPLRPGVTEAVRKCQIAGIKVRMVTGDNIMTAKAIALECGIFTEKGFAIEGKQFREMEKEEQYRIIPYLQVMARSSPTDKHTLVKRLLEMGDIVAVTGDGTNDAPALHEASIGLAMGIAGTEVAKESADIVILDDNFASIVKMGKGCLFRYPKHHSILLYSTWSGIAMWVVRWGRSVYSNIQKFIQFQCTVNGVALALNFIAALADGRAPLTAVQLLWVNLIMDTMGALALATEPPNEILMHREPVRKRDPLITNIMWRNMFGQFLYQLILLLVLHFHGKIILGLPLDEIPSGPEHLTHADKEVETVIFNAFVFCQVFNEFNARKPEEINVLKGIWQSKIFIYVFFITCCVQVILVELCGSFTSTVNLSWHRWLLCVALGFFSMPLAAVFKLVPVPKKPFLSTWQKHNDLIFREGGSVMSMMFRQGSSKNASTLQKLKSVKSTKFYRDFSGDRSDDILKRVIWGPASGPSATSDIENPHKRNANEAWT